MKLPVLSVLAFRYLWRYKRRYLFLFLALGFGFAVVTVVSSLKDGMEESLYLSAQSHYAGDIVAIGYDTGSRVGHHLPEAEAASVMEAAQAAGLGAARAVRRTTLMGMREGTVFFNGFSVPLKHIAGVDWENEAEYFSRLAYTAPPDPGTDHSILLSAPVAKELGARQGDGVILETLSAGGQKNTGAFTVAGIVEDSSFFGYYKAYLSRRALNDLIGFAPEDCSLIGFFLPRRSAVASGREALHRELRDRTRTGPLVYDRENFNRETNNLAEGITVFLVTLPVYLSEVAQLMDAIGLAAWVLHGMMLAIIMVSAAVTCRLILHERLRETGTMRAIGFYESDLRFVLELEILVMALLSMAAGFLVALIINQVLSYTSFTWFPGFEVFLRDGRLASFYLPRTVAFNVLSLCVMLILAVWGPVFRTSRNPLPETLSGGAL